MAGDSCRVSDCMSLCDLRAPSFRLFSGELVEPDFRVRNYTPKDLVGQRSNPNHVAQFLYRRCALLQRSIFFGCQLDFDDFFQARRSELARNADVKSIDPVLALEICRARKNLLL